MPGLKLLNKGFWRLLTEVVCVGLDLGRALEPRGIQLLILQVWSQLERRTDGLTSSRATDITWGRWVFVRRMDYRLRRSWSHRCCGLFSSITRLSKSNMEV